MYDMFGGYVIPRSCMKTPLEVLAMPLANNNTKHLYISDKA